MRLLNVQSGAFHEFYDRDNTPKYVTASHRWVQRETSFREYYEERNVHSEGHRKVTAFKAYVEKNIPWVGYLWIDSCCINRDSTAELSEAVNLMFDWYRNAELCVAYLADVQEIEDLESSEWFRRGWTLQELLAPAVVVFVNKNWEIIGNRGASKHAGIATNYGPSLESRLAKITHIPEQVLYDYTSSLHMSIEDRMKWMEGRKTTREEDLSYALYGIFSVSPGANYGERHSGARQRLLSAIQQRENTADRPSPGLTSPGFNTASPNQDPPNLATWSQDQKTKLLLAVGSGNLSTVQGLVWEDPSAIFAKNFNEQTALHLAARAGNLEMAQFLISSGADVNAMDDHRRLPLHEAVEASSLPVVRALMARGANNSSQDDKGRSPRSITPKSSLMAWILEYGADFSTRNSEGFSALTWFAHRGDVPAVRALLDMGIDIEAYGREQHNALYEALKSDQLETVKFLLSRGTEVDALDHRQNTPLVLSGLAGHTRIGEALLDHGADINASNECGFSALNECCDHGRQIMAFMLLRRGANFRHYNSSGWAPIHQAAAHGYIDLVREMLDLGESVDRRLIGYRSTALHHACARHRHNVVNLLLVRGATVDIRDSNMATPLFRACQARAFDSVRFCLQRGADITLQDENGWSPILHASADGYAEIVELLLSSAAEHNVTSIDIREAGLGYTPLNLAARNGHKDVVEYLLNSNKAEINATNDDGWTSLTEACFHNRSEVVQILLRRGAETDHRTKDEQTAYDLASLQGHEQIVRILESFSTGNLS